MFVVFVYVFVLWLCCCFVVLCCVVVVCFVVCVCVGFCCVIRQRVSRNIRDVLCSDDQHWLS